MKKVLIYAGTTEGRELAEYLSRNGIYCVACVATEYGEQVMEENEFLKVHRGRMTAEMMRNFTLEEGFCAVVDATHPFAMEATKHIALSVQETGIPCFRLSRDTNDTGMASSTTGMGNTNDGASANTDAGTNNCASTNTDAGTNNCASINTDAGTNNCASTNIDAGTNKCASIDSDAGTNNCASTNTDTNTTMPQLRFFKDTKECVKALYEKEGKVLLTTGSKELSLFTQDPDIRCRLVARVLPGMESLQLCYDAGLVGKQIIAMQGPFTVEMNLAMIKQYQITCLVTKESGKTGGVDTKFKAAAEAGIPVYVIQNPETAEAGGMSFTDVIKNLSGVINASNVEGSDVAHKNNSEAIIELSQNISEVIGTTDIVEEQTIVSQDLGETVVKKKVTLVGMGMGQADSMTLEAKKAIEEAQLLFGAPRMLEKTPAETEKLPFYLAADIVPEIQRRTKLTKAAVLFSGDTGFYSGAAKLREELLKADCEVVILPGISSVSAMAAKTGITWQDAVLYSMHGKQEKLWKQELSQQLPTWKKTFLLLSGVSQLHDFAGFIEEMNLQNLTVHVGYQLSYENEFVGICTLEECKVRTEEGLYILIVTHEINVTGSRVDDNIAGSKVVQESGKLELCGTSDRELGMTIQNSEVSIFGVTNTKSIITPGHKDDDFIRGKVPMTKEEVREVSICKLKLTRDAVVYDVGSGTGSIAVEIAELASDGTVYALETKPEAVELIQANKEKFGLHNINVIPGMAPDCMEDLPAPTHAFIGGTKGNMKAILTSLRAKNPNMRVVVNAISLETIAEISEIRKTIPVKDYEVVQLQVSRGKELGDYCLMQAENPVTVCSFTFASAE